MRSPFILRGFGAVAVSVGYLLAITSFGCNTPPPSVPSSATTAPTAPPKTPEQVKQKKRKALAEAKAAKNKQIQAAFAESNGLIKIGKFEEAVDALRKVKSVDPSRVMPRIAIVKKSSGETLMNTAKEIRRKNPELALEMLGRSSSFGIGEAERMIPRVKRELAQKEERERLAAARAKRAKEREEMKYYSGDGSVQIAVGNITLKSSTELHTARGKSTFAHVFISAKNVGDDIVHVNPNDFTLSDQDGNTVSAASDTYGIANYFDAVDLRPNQQTSGWIIFYLSKDSRYTLNHQGFGSNTQKDVVL